ncbi:MAG TPA: T9SS type A sorting domain-containing protein, partial [Ignavibacteriaceae bacterium]
TYSNAMGSSRRLSNHNTFVGWGTTTTPAISEVNAEGNVTFYLSHQDTFFNYRAFKFPWKTNYFVTKPDSLFFGFVPEGDSLTLNLEIKNNSNGEIEINGLLNRDSAFYVNTPLPIIISAQGTANMQVTFKPPLNGNYSDDLHLQWNRETERIAQVVKMSGTTITFAGGYPDELTYSLKQNYPNPFNPVTKINFTIPEEGDVALEVFDILGRRIKSLLNERMTKGSYNINFEADDLPSGVYIYILKVNDYIASNKMMLLR